MKKIKFNQKSKISRKDLANPYRNISFRSQVKNSGSINLSNNYKINDLNNGYDEIVPIDKNKKIK